MYKGCTIQNWVIDANSKQLYMSNDFPRIFVNLHIPLKMNFKTHRITNNSSTIHLLKYDEFDPTEYFEKLTSLEIERFYSFKNIKRKREFVATRILRHNNLGFEHIHYNSNGAPYINNEGFISISHSANMVGLAINKVHSVGLDLEVPRDRILSIKSKFVSEREMKLFDTDDASIVTRLWSAKEALYKLAGRKQILFIEELHISMNENNDWIGTIINPDHQLCVKLDIFEHEGIIVTINSEAVERIE